MTKTGDVRFEPARLLVVDDDPILREFAVSELTSAFVTVETAAHGALGWERLVEGGIDIALVDLEMPVMDGFTLIAQMRADERFYTLPVVVATSRDDMEAIDRAYAAGATSFVLKPLNWRVVSYQMSYVLRNSREAARIRTRARSLRQTVRAQDEALSLCQAGIDDLLQRLLDDTGPGHFATVWSELETLSRMMREKTSAAR